MTADVAQDGGLFPWDKLVRECQGDPALWHFVTREAPRAGDVRQLADWSSVVAESRPDRAFAEATALRSYAAYAERANACAQATAELTELADGLGWRSIYRFLTCSPGLVLVLASVGFALVWGDYRALAAQAAAITLVPVVGLLWRGARPERARRARTLGWLLAGSLLLLMLALLVFPMLTGTTFLPWAAFLVVACPTVAGVFAVDHRRNSLLRDAKMLCLLRKGRTLPRQADKARDRWLDEARDTAVSQELTQAINRLLAPEHERRLFVRSAAGLRAVHDEESQVRTHAAERAERVLDRIDGASVAIAGPRGSGKTNLLTELSRAESRFSVCVSAPTQYASREFLLLLFQELCTKYISDQGGLARRSAAWRRTAAEFARDNTIPLLRLAGCCVLTGLLIWDLVSHAAARDMDRFPRELWLDRTALYAVVVGVLIAVGLPKRLRFGWRGARLITKARGYLAELRFEQTMTSQVQSTIAMVQGTYSRASKRLPWTMPELVDRLREFLEDIAKAEAGPRGRNRQVLVCIDEVDRIGSADDATRFLSEVKAIFGTPHCYFAVAIADELGVQLGGRAVAARPLSDNAFDEIISIEPMTFDMCRDLLTRRVLGFTESFVWLSLVLSGGLPRDVIRVARRLVEMAIESDHDLRLSGCAEQLVREEVYEAAIASRGQHTRLLSQADWAAAIDELRVQIRAFESGRAPADPRPSLRTLAKLADSVPESAGPETRSLATWLATLSLLGLTTCEAFADATFDIVSMRDRAASASQHYEDLADARRELGVSAEGCRAAVEQVRKVLHLDAV